MTIKIKLKQSLLCLGIALTWVTAWADSTGIAPGGSHPMHTVIAIPTQPVPNESYAKLPPCPTTMTRCPDINAAVGPGPSTCPDACTVTRQIFDNTGSLTPDVPATGLRGGTTKAAVCPAGYANVGVYNVQNEVKYYDRNTTYVPVVSKALYDELNQTPGFSCGPTNLHQSYSSGCIWNGAGFEQEYTPGQLTDAMHHANGVVQVTSADWSAYCANVKHSCALHCCFGCGGPRIWVYQYTFLGCSVIAGLYQTGNKVPISAVCTRARPRWQPST